MESYNIAAGMGAARIDAPQSPFLNIRDRVDDMEALRNRIAALADRICGATPQAIEGKKGIESGHGGVVGALKQSSDAISAAINAAHDELSRIERLLP